MFNINFCRCLDSNLGPLELEVTALQTEPQKRLVKDRFKKLTSLHLSHLWLDNFPHKKQSPLRRGISAEKLNLNHVTKY